MQGHSFVETQLSYIFKRESTFPCKYRDTMKNTWTHLCSFTLILQRCNHFSGWKMFSCNYRDGPWRISVSSIKVEVWKWMLNCISGVVSIEYKTDPNILLCGGQVLSFLLKQNWQFGKFSNLANYMRSIFNYL